MKKYFLSALCGAIPFFSITLLAQHSLSPVVIASGGAYQTSASGSLSFTFGEIMTETFTSGSSSYIITQGFQQPAKGMVGVEEQTASWDITIFPNPFTDILNIRVDFPGSLELATALTDINGRMVGTGTSPIQHGGGNGIYTIPSAHLSAGVYILTLSDTKTGAVQVFRIIKKS